MLPYETGRNDDSSEAARQEELLNHAGRFMRRRWRPLSRSVVASSFTGNFLMWLFSKERETPIQTVPPCALEKRVKFRFTLSTPPIGTKG